MQTLILGAAIVAGGAWRCLDGLGIPAHMTWLRTLACFGLAVAVLIGSAPLLSTLAVAGAFALAWTPKQKPREDLQTMLFRWALLSAIGGWLAFVTGLWLPGLALTIAGFGVGVCAWAGTQGRFWAWLPVWWSRRANPDAIMCAIEGALAFGALALVRL